MALGLQFLGKPRFFYRNGFIPSLGSPGFPGSYGPCPPASAPDPLWPARWPRPERSPAGLGLAWLGSAWLWLAALRPSAGFGLDFGWISVGLI